MAHTINERPPAFCLSKNEIRYVYTLTDLSRAGLELQIKLFYIRKSDNANVQIGGNFNLKPDANGKVYFYLNAYIDSLLTYNMPANSLVNECDTQYTQFFVHTREVWDADVTEAFSVAYFFAMCLTVIWCSSILEIIFKQKIHQNVNQDEHLYSNDLYQTTHYPSKHPLLIISVGLVLGFAIGSIKITLFNSSIVIGSMGCLFSGVIIGKLTPISSKVAHLRSDAVKIIQAFGLSTFIAAIGLAAGSNIVKNFSHNGIRLVIISSVESLFILLVMTLIGKYIFKYQNVAEFGGVLSGARCSSTACAVVIDKAGNNSPIPSFVVTFILTNIISSFFGSMIVFLT